MPLKEQEIKCRIEMLTWGIKALVGKEFGTRVFSKKVLYMKMEIDLCAHLIHFFSKKLPVQIHIKYARDYIECDNQTSPNSLLPNANVVGAYYINNVLRCKQRDAAPYQVGPC